MHSTKRSLDELWLAYQSPPMMWYEGLRRAGKPLNLGGSSRRIIPVRVSSSDGTEDGLRTKIPTVFGVLVKPSSRLCARDGQRGKRRLHSIGVYSLHRIHRAPCSLDSPRSGVLACPLYLPVPQVEISIKFSSCDVSESYMLLFRHNRRHWRNLMANISIVEGWLIVKVGIEELEK